jgi:hypothetical protein
MPHVVFSPEDMIQYKILLPMKKSSWETVEFLFGSQDDFWHYYDSHESPILIIPFISGGHSHWNHGSMCHKQYKKLASKA